MDSPPENTTRLEVGKAGNMDLAASSKQVALELRFAMLLSRCAALPPHSPESDCHSGFVPPCHNNAAGVEREFDRTSASLAPNPGRHHNGDDPMMNDRGPLLLSLRGIQ